MNNKLTIKKVINFKSSRSKVWDALTNPEIIQEYLFGTEVISGWKEGSVMIFKGEWNGQSYQDKGKIISLENEKQLQYEYWSRFSGLEDRPENYSLISYELSEENGGTLLVLTQTGFATEQARSHSELSWHVVFDKMKEIIE